MQRDDLGGSQLHAELSKALAGIQAEHLDHAPENAIAFHHGNVVVAVMHEVLTTAEKVLAQNGAKRDVRDARELFRQVMEPDFRAAVERLTGRRVIASLGANHFEPDVAGEIFILDAPL